MYRSFALAACSLLLAAATGGTQVSASNPPGVSTLSTVSGDSADRLRIGQLDARGESASFLLRSTSMLLRDPREQTGRSFNWVLPLVSLVTNSGLPAGENLGALWAGKGPNARFLAGVDLGIGAVRVTIIPELAYSSNEFFEYTQFSAPPLPASRNPYASPWNVYPYSTDVPPRMGPDHVVRIAPGQSSISLRARSLDIGVTTENEWWGPGIRTGIVLSDNAEGFPRAFVKPHALQKTRAGTFDFRMTWGGLSESPFFDTDPANDLRYWSAFAGTWTPALEPDLTLGFSRAVFGPVDNWGAIAVRPLNFLLPTDRPNARSLSDTSFRPSADQIFSFFGRWVFPGQGFEAYAEWARTELPASLRDLLVDPEHSQGYTFGLQWLGKPNPTGRLRIQGEHSYLEQDPSFVNRPLGSFYTSRSVIQGYTNRGKVIGAGMGQGSSGEWLATDWIARNYSVGIFLTRTRFNNDAYFLLPFDYGRGNCQHDVTAGSGLRGAARTRFGRVTARYSGVKRYNAFFQNASACESFAKVIDVRNRSLEVGFSLER